jgi:hypothetical protein
MAEVANAVETGLRPLRICMRWPFQVRSLTRFIDAWSHVPIHILHKELKRRQDNGEKPACGSEDNKGEYDLGLHVFALFLILLLSTLGTRLVCCTSEP